MALTQALYTMVQYFSRIHTAKLSDIRTVAIWNALDSQNYGYATVLKAVLASLQQLESDKGLAVSVDGTIEMIHGAMLGFLQII